MNASVNLAMDYPLLNIFWTVAVIFLWLLWFMLLFRVIGDIFRDHELGGWGKAGWSVFVVILPFLGVFVYLIARGKSMQTREMARAERSEEAFRQYVRTNAGTAGSADELTRLAELKSRGELTDAEYEKAKAKALV